MHLLHTLTAAWGAVQLHLAAFFGLLWLRRREDVEHAAFSALTAGLGVYALAGSIAGSRPSPAEADPWMRLQVAGAALGMLGMVELCRVLAPGHCPRMHGPARLVACVWLGALAAGLVFDPAFPIDSPDPPPIQAPRTMELRLDAVGSVLATSGLVVVAPALVGLLRAARHSGDARRCAVAVCLVGACGTHDLVAQLAHVRVVQLLDHATLVASMLVATVLLRRHVRAEHELGVRTAQLEHETELLQRAQDELVRREQLTAIGSLSATIAHEVRNPLAILKNAVAGLRRAPATSDDHALLLEIVEEETSRLTRLLNELLAYARPLRLRPERVEMAVVLADAVAQGLQAARDPSRIQIDLDVGEAAVRGDADLLRQAFASLAENAAQAMPEGGSLVVRARRARLEGRRAWAIAMRDSGEGMDTLVRSRARDPFFTTRPAGTGLGLAIVERIVRAHGGRLDIDSRYGAGTTVTVTLPRA
ncbi:MAG: ATP-binding protein [Myxococcota bacterium]|nr:ATP-binding protein [Myxococcota bacterium]MDW8362320.1 ATP-binding protein [Myxococcales bacterium]